MNIPNMPQAKFLTESGDLHQDWTMYLNQLTDELQKNVSNEGYVVPAQTASNIEKLNNTKNVAKILYDANSSVMKLNNNGKFKEIYTRPEQATSAEIAAIPTAQINGTWVYNTETNKLLYGINNTFKEVAFS